jgi:hypothetical protein
MTSISPIYLLYLVLIDCCMPTCECTYTKLSKNDMFLGQILNPKTKSFLGQRECIGLYTIIKIHESFSCHLILQHVSTFLRLST